MKTNEVAAANTFRRRYAGERGEGGIVFDVRACSRMLISFGLAVLSLSCVANGVRGKGAARSSPGLEYRDVRGCGNLVVSAASEDRKEYLVVHASRMRLGLSQAEVWFDLGAPPDGLTVQVDMYRQPPETEEPYCTDVVDAGEGPIETWKATRGKLRLSLTGFVEAQEGQRQEEYWAHIRLEYAAFQNAAGDVVWQDAPIELDAEVGWMNG